MIQRKAEDDARFPRSILAPQFELLKALAIGKTQSLPVFEASLLDVIKNNPEDPVKDRAQEILDAIHARGTTPPPVTPEPGGTKGAPDSGIAEGSKTEDGKTEGSKTDTGKSGSEPGAPTTVAFKYNPDTVHFVVVIFQNIGGAIDPTKYKTKLSNFNSTNYGSKGIQVQELLFGPRNKIFILRSFANKSEALSYNSNLYDNDDVYGNVSTDEYHQYVISANNLSELIRQMKVDEYEDFYRNFYR